MTGLSRTTGRAMDAASDAHVIQSIEDILTTPIGQRVMRPTYGSFLFELIDQPLNALPADIHILAPSGARLEADVVINGDVQVNGDLKASGVVTGDTDVVFDGKSAKGHKHTGVTAGSAVSGEPQ